MAKQTSTVNNLAAQLAALQAQLATAQQQDAVPAAIAVPKSPGGIETSIAPDGSLLIKVNRTQPLYTTQGKRDEKTGAIRGGGNLMYATTHGNIDMGEGFVLSLNFYKRGAKL